MQHQNSKCNTLLHSQPWVRAVSQRLASVQARDNGATASYVWISVPDVYRTKCFSISLPSNDGWLFYDWSFSANDFANQTTVWSQWRRVGARCAWPDGTII